MGNGRWAMGDLQMQNADCRLASRARLDSVAQQEISALRAEVQRAEGKAQCGLELMGEYWSAFTFPWWASR
jgi:hypothetical protein